MAAQAREPLARAHTNGTQVNRFLCVDEQTSNVQMPVRDSKLERRDAVQIAGGGVGVRGKQRLDDIQVPARTGMRKSRRAVEVNPMN